MGENRNVNGYTVEELVTKIRSGEDLYFEPLLERFAPLIQKFNKMYYLRAMELDDFWQEARIVLHKSILVYNAEREMKFASFYKLMLKNHIFSLLRKEAALKRRIDKEAVSFDGFESAEGGMPVMYPLKGTTRFLSPDKVVEVREASSGYLDTLSKFEKEVFRRYIEGKDFQTIAGELDVEVLKIKNAYDRCRKKLKLLLS